MLFEQILSTPLGGWHNAAGLLFVLLTAVLVYRPREGDGGPPKLGETIPFLSNSLQFAIDPQTLWDRTLKKMQSAKTEILRLHLGGRPVFVVVGEKKTNPLFRVNTGFSMKRVHEIFSEVMFAPSKRDHGRFVADVTGLDTKPFPGTEHVEDRDRIWMRLYNSHHENHLRTKPTNSLGARFFDRFIALTTEMFSLGKPTEILVWQFLHRHQTEVAARVLGGNLIFNMNPGYLDALFKFDLAVMPVAFGPPRWIRPQPHRDRTKFFDMQRKYMAKALELFDWDSPAAKSDWEPIFGSPLIRSIVRWGLDINLDTETIAGICGMQVSAQNANSVPASAWVIMGALTCPDPELLPNLRRESQAAVLISEDTGKTTFDIQKLVTSPWLQAIYTEVLRLRIMFVIFRDADRDTEIDGFAIPKGAMVLSPMTIAHKNEAWGVEGHPPQEFWPQRHLTEVVAADGTKTWEFAIGSRSGYFFPYGGGPNMCPGRNFAKQEIIGTVALILTQFEMEVVGWVMPDGVSPSDREAWNGEGMVVTQPDRDLKVRITRKW